MKKQIVEVAREQLYAEVWATPMIKLAKKYGLSDVGLRKACKRNNIPTPPAGYWAKLAHGKKVKNPKLPSMDDAPPIRFQISASDNMGLKDSALAAETEKLLAFEAQAENRIVVPEEAGTLHPFTEEIKADRRPEDAKTRFLLDVSKPYLSRALRVADALIRALDARGYLMNGIFEQSLSLGITEILDSVMKESARERMEKSGATRADPFADYARFPTGRLKLQVDPKQYHLGDGIRHNWADGKTQRIEDFLNDVICSLIKKAATQRDRDLMWERLRLQQAEEERRLKEEAERIQRKKERRAELIQEAELWQKAKLIREYITAYENEHGVSGQTKWAREEADRLDPLKTGGDPKVALQRLAEYVENISQEEAAKELNRIGAQLRAQA
jgi:hypothetical protein